MQKQEQGPWRPQSMRAYHDLPKPGNPATFYWILMLLLLAWAANQQGCQPGLRQLQERPENYQVGYILCWKSEPTSNLLWKQNAAPAVHLTKQKNKPEKVEQQAFPGDETLTATCSSIYQLAMIYLCQMLLKSAEELQGPRVKNFFFSLPSRHNQLQMAITWAAWTSAEVKTQCLHTKNNHHLHHHQQQKNPVSLIFPLIDLTSNVKLSWTLIGCL